MMPTKDVYENTATLISDCMQALRGPGTRYALYILIEIWSHQNNLRVIFLILFSHITISYL